MSFFGRLFSPSTANSQSDQQQTDPASPDTNPYTPLYNAYNSPMMRLMGGTSVAQERAQAQVQAQAWQAAHDYANHVGQFAPPIQGATGPLSVTDGMTATADGGVANTSPPPASYRSSSPGYTSSPGPMDAIAAQAQGYGQVPSAGPPGYLSQAEQFVGRMFRPQPQGGTSLVDTGRQPLVPSYDDLGLPRTRQQTARDALRLAAANANPNLALSAYDWADPASRYDATPQYMTGQNGEVYRVENGQFTLAKGPDQRFVQYSDAMGYPHMGWLQPPTTAPAGPPTKSGQPWSAQSQADQSQSAAASNGPPRLGQSQGAAATSGGGGATVPMLGNSTWNGQAQPVGTATAGPPRKGTVYVTPPRLSDNEAVQALQVALAEDPQNPQGILSTIINRAAASGKSINDVLQEKGQFETVSNGRAAQVPTSRAIQLYQNPGVQAIFGGQIPAQYAGVTQFYAPGAQAALRRPTPPWDDGSGFDVGRTRFFSRAFEGNAVPTYDPNPPVPQSGPPMLNGGASGFQEVALPGTGGDTSGAGASGPLDPMSESIAQAIAGIKMAPLPIGGRNSPRNAVIMSRVLQISPNFDGQAWQKRQDTTKNFFNGPAGKQLGSLNTAIEHLGGLADSIDTINNSDSPGGLNWAGNMLSNATAFGPKAQQRVGAYNSLDLNIKTAVQEALSAYKTAGGSEGEFNGMLKDFDVNGSRTSQYQVLQKVLGLLNGKRQQLLQQYQTGMGPDIPVPSQLLDPNADTVANRIDAGATGLRSGDSGVYGPPTKAPAGFRIIGVR